MQIALFQKADAPLGQRSDSGHLQQLKSPDDATVLYDMSSNIQLCGAEPNLNRESRAQSA